MALPKCRDIAGSGRHLLEMDPDIYRSGLYLLAAPDSELTIVVPTPSPQSTRSVDRVARVANE